MHVAMITDTAADGVQVPDLTDALVARGHQVTVREAAADRPAELSERLAREWRQEQPDVAHAFSPGAGMAVVAAARQHEVPLVQDYRTVEGAQLDRQDPRWLRLEVALGHQAERVVASGATHAERLVAHGVPRSKVGTVPYGVDFGVFVPDGPEAEHTCRHRLVSAAGTADGEGSDELVRALAQMPETELVVVGDVAAEDHARLTKLAADVGVTERVRFAGALDDAALAALYRSAELAVSASGEGALDLTMLQAMACGTAVVSTSGEGVDDLVVDGVTGVLVPTKSPRRLAVVIRDLLAQPPRLAAYGIAGADRASVCHSWDRVGDSAEAVYAHAVSGRYTGADTRGSYRPD